MKILLPTDFSKLSKNAVHYAAKLAKELNAEIVLLHVVYIDAPPRVQVALKTPRIIDAMIENAIQNFEALVKELRKEVGNKINVSYKIEKGNPIEDVVETFAQHNDIDLIVMGTKGASGLKKVLMGSVATATIRKSSIPVITVPEYARFKKIKQIIYASDMLAVNKEINMLIQFARLFNSSIHLLHIVPPASQKKIDRIRIKNELISKYKYPKIYVHISVNDDVQEAIEEYIADQNADLLAMFTHKPTFFEILFGKSVTREMAFHSRISLLSIKK